MCSLWIHITKTKDVVRNFLLCTWLFFVCAELTEWKFPSHLVWMVVNRLKLFCSFRNWKVVVNKTVYHINLCVNVAHDGCPQDSSVCSTLVDDSPNSRESLGSRNRRTFNTTTGVAGFRIEYTGEKCNGRGAGSKTWNTTIVMKCGKFLVSFVWLVTIGQAARWSSQVVNLYRLFCLHVEASNRESIHL